TNAGWQIASAQAFPAVPEEIYILWLIEKFDNVRAFIGSDNDAQLLIFKRHTAIAFINEFFNPTAVVTIVMIGLIVHILDRKVLFRIGILCLPSNANLQLQFPPPHPRRLVAIVRAELTGHRPPI